MQDDLYPPGMAPADAKRDASLPRPKVHSRPPRPDTVRPADLLPPGAAEPTPHIDDAASELAELLPDAALPPEADIPAPIPSSVAPGAQPKLALSTAPSAVRVAKQRDRQAARFLLLAALSSAALVTLLGVGYFLINQQRRTTAQADPEPPHVERPPPAQKKPATERPARRPKPAIQEKVPPVLRSNESNVEESSSPDQFAPASPVAVATPSDITPPTAPVSPEPAPPITLTKAQIEPLVKALDAAKTALSEANFEAAEANIKKAQTLAKLPKHQDAVARLEEISTYVQKFHEAIKAAAQAMQAGETFKVGSSTQVSFVEAKPDKIILRIAGMNKTYPLNDLPPGLALAIAEFKLPSADPASNVIKGAYLLVHKRADSDSREKAKALWQEAQSSGVNLTHLMPFLDDDYAKLPQDATN